MANIVNPNFLSTPSSGIFLIFSHFDLIILPSYMASFQRSFKKLYCIKLIAFLITFGLQNQTLAEHLSVLGIISHLWLINSCSLKIKIYFQYFIYIFISVQMVQWVIFLDKNLHLTGNFLLDQVLFNDFDDFFQIF